MGLYQPLLSWAWQLTKYGVVSLGELVSGYGLMNYLQRRNLSKWWAFVIQSLVTGLAAFVVRKEWVFD